MPKIKLIGDIRCIGGVAASGGPDSMALLHFLKKGGHKPRAYFFDHNTKSSEDARTFLVDYCKEERIALIIDGLKEGKGKGSSWEEFWRIKRYEFLHRQQCIIATGHHLNDVAETYIWGIANGRTRFIHYCKPINDGPSNIVRPFLLTTKRSLLEWCYKNSTPFLKDPSNQDLVFTRNRIRHNIIPEIEKVNPGFLKIIRKMMLKRFEDSKQFKKGKLDGTY